MENSTMSKELTSIFSGKILAMADVPSQRLASKESEDYFRTL